MLREIKKGLTVIREIDLPFLFKSNDPVHASWITGTIRVPRGNLVEYIHMDYFSVFEEDIFLSFLKGILVETKIVKNI